MRINLNYFFAHLKMKVTQSKSIRLNLLGTLLVISSGVVFSLAGVLTKMIEADAWTIAAWRGLFGGLMILLYVAWRGRGETLLCTFNLGWRGWLLASIGSLASLAFIFAFKMTYVANVAVIYAAAPFIAAGLSWLLIREPLRMQTAIAATFTVFGVMIVVSGSLGSSVILGDIVALAMAVSNALYMVLIRVFRETPVVLAGGVSALQLFALSWFAIDPLAVKQPDIVLLALFGISFAVAVILWTEGTKLIPATESALLGSAETPFAILFAWALISELPPFSVFVGGGIILLAVYAHATFDAAKQPDRR